MVKQLCTAEENFHFLKEIFFKFKLWTIWIFFEQKARNSINGKFRKTLELTSSCGEKVA